MVERLKQAIEKARAQRGETLASPSVRPAAGAETAERGNSGGFWDNLKKLEISEEIFLNSRIVSYKKSDPAHVPFDLLRTRLLRVMQANNWRRLAITSPTKGCGKTLVSANLAFSFARQPDLRTLLVDMDLKAPAQAKIMGCSDAPKLAHYLEGRLPLEQTLCKAGANMALALNSERVINSTELIQQDKTGGQLAHMLREVDPDIVIYDLPPLLLCDDTIAFTRHVDCVLMVVGGGETTAREVEQCESILAENTNFLGVLLNKSEDHPVGKGYEYY